MLYIDAQGTLDETTPSRALALANLTKVRNGEIADQVTADRLTADAILYLNGA